MKINDILGFDTFYQKIEDKRLPFRVAYKFSKLSKAVNLELDFYRQKLAEILQEYTQKDDDGNFIYLGENKESIKIQEGREQECNEKLTELHNMDIDIDNVTFSIEEVESLEMTIAEIGALMPFIEE